MTTPARSWSCCGALGARVATVPDAKDVCRGDKSGRLRGDGPPGVAAAVAQSAVCLLVGTRMTVTARAGLDEVLSTVATFSVGSAPPYLPCTHIDAADLRATLAFLAAEVTGRGGWIRCLQ